MTTESTSPVPEYEQCDCETCAHSDLPFNATPCKTCGDDGITFGNWTPPATPAPARADHATVEQWEAALTAVMPADFKDWHQNSRWEWPEIAAGVIRNLRHREGEAWAIVERLQSPVAHQKPVA